MIYTVDNFSGDVLKTARSLHLSYGRCVYLLQRWDEGMNTEFIDDEMVNFMNRVQELVTQYNNENYIKFLSVKSKSDLNLPTDPVIELGET